MEGGSSRLLTREQARYLVGQPDIILQFSHFLADQWRIDGHRYVEVRAFANVSLNGREYVPLVDPTVDLAAEELTIMPAEWITSLDEYMRLVEERRSDEARN